MVTRRKRKLSRRWEWSMVLSRSHVGAGQRRDHGICDFRKSH